MNHLKLGILFLFIYNLIIVRNCYAQEINKSPNDVFTELRVIKASIRHYISINEVKLTIPVGLVSFEGANPADVFALTYALHEKIRILLKKNKIKTFKEVVIPKTEISSNDVFELMLTVQSNIKSLVPLKHENCIQRINYTPIDVLREVVIVNNLLDSILFNDIYPKNPLNLVNQIEHHLFNIIKFKNIKSSIYKIKNLLNIVPGDVFINAEIFHSKLRMLDNNYLHKNHPKMPYYYPKNKKDLLPYHVFTLSAINLARIIMISRQLNLTTHNKSSIVTKEVTPEDVFKQYIVVNHMLSKLLVDW